MNCSCQTVTENVLGESIMGAKKECPRKAAWPSAGISIIPVSFYILTVWSREIHPSRLSW